MPKFASFWLANTHAVEAEPGETIRLYRTVEEASIPYRTASGRFIVAKTSTDNETIALHNAACGHRDAMNAASLPEWPWTCLLDSLISRTGFNAQSFTFPEAPDSAVEDAATSCDDTEEAVNASPSCVVGKPRRGDQPASAT